MFVVRNRFGLWAVLLIAVFLAGYVPVEIRASRLRTDLAAATWRNRQLELRDLAALACLQAAQKNFGLAGQTSIQFFEQAQALGKNSQGAQQKALAAILALRGKITQELTNAAPDSLGDLQSLYLATRDATAP